MTGNERLFGQHTGTGNTRSYVVPSTKNDASHTRIDTVIPGGKTRVLQWRAACAQWRCHCHGTGMTASALHHLHVQVEEEELHSVHV